MNVVEAIYGRRSVRSYSPRPVDDDTVRSLLRAATNAPSAMNAQPWLFAVVQNREQLARYSERAKRLLLETVQDLQPRHAGLMREPSYDVFHGAGTLVAIGAAERGPFTDADCWLAAEALMLAAYDLGLGTCPIGFAVAVLNLPDVKRELGFPEQGAVVAPLALGWPSAPAPAVPRSPPRIASWSR